MQALRTRIKVCGMTRAEDIVSASRCGADAIGLVFYPPSPRYISVAEAQELVRAVPLFVDVVALFVDPEPDLVWSVLEHVSPEVLQFHGDEDPAFCAQFQRPYIKALRVRPEQALAPLVERYSAARGILLDAYQPGVPGGTGRTFDWNLVPDDLRNKIVLAGGLSPTNVADAVARVQPWGVDVSGGVESGKGIKDDYLIQQFVVQVQAGDSASGASTGVG